VKTAISVPDETFARATQAARVLRISRSELFSRAVERFLDELEDDAVTARIDAALARLGDDGSVAAAVAVGRRRVGGGDGDW
jgi:predicted transcriptional regulator